MKYFKCQNCGQQGYEADLSDINLETPRKFILRVKCEDCGAENELIFTLSDVRLLEEAK